MTRTRHVPDDERRARLARRHALAEPVADCLGATEAVVCLHGTEPASIYLSLAARTGADRAEIERALFVERSVIRNLAMRRTVFGFPRALLPAALGSASARVARVQRNRLLADATEAGVADPDAWASDQAARLLRLLTERGGLTTAQIRAEVAELDRRVVRAPGKSYQGQTSLARAMVVVLDAEGAITRGHNGGAWKVSRPEWTTMSAWLGEDCAARTEQEGYAALVRAWLSRFGPGTEADLVWWLGATKSAVRSALIQVEAVPVEIAGGEPAYLLPDDLEPVPPVEPWAALLPALDPTVMGWKGRGFYLGAHATQVFDRNGNGGPTAWWDGRVVGSWIQRDDGEVVIVPAEKLSRAAATALGERARALTDWLGGEVVRSLYQTPISRAALAGSSSST